MKTTTSLVLILTICVNTISQTYFSEDFEPIGGTLDQNNAWTTLVVTAHPDGYDWYHSDFSGNAYAKVSNFNSITSSNSPMETWLISPEIDLSLATNPHLNFENVKRFSGDDLNVFISTDYNTSSTPTWTNITSFLNMDTDVSSWDFVNSGYLDISSYISSAPNSVTLGFQYQGGASDGSIYQIDNVTIVNLVTGIIQNDQSSTFSFHPNPSKSSSSLTLNIDQNSLVKLINPIGKTCFSKQLTKGNHFIDLSNFSKGCYFICVNNQTKKLIIK